MAPEVGAVVDRLGPTGWCAGRVMSTLDVLACLSGYSSGGYPPCASCMVFE